MGVESFGGFQPEEPTQETKDQIVKLETSRHAERLDALPPESREVVQRASRAFEYALTNVITHMESDPQIIESALRFATHLANHSDRVITGGELDLKKVEHERKELRALLGGAALVADSSAELRTPDGRVPVGSEQLENLHDFLDLVKKRVGHLDPENEATALLKVTVEGDGSAEHYVSHGREV